MMCMSVRCRVAHFQALTGPDGGPGTRNPRIGVPSVTPCLGPGRSDLSSLGVCAGVRYSAGTQSLVTFRGRFADLWWMCHDLISFTFRSTSPNPRQGA